MTAQAELRRALRERLGPVLRTAGYRGTPPNWRRVNTEGDAAVVNVQSSAFSSADSVKCIVNLAVVPRGWSEYMTEVHGHRPHAAVPFYWGVYRSRIGAADPEGWWEVSDGSSADAVCAEIATALNDVALPELDALLNRDQLLDRVRQGGFEVLMGGSDIVAEAVLLADAGRQQELDQVLPRLTAELAEWTLLTRFVDWLLARSKAQGRS